MSAGKTDITKIENVFGKTTAHPTGRAKHKAFAKKFNKVFRFQMRHRSGILINARPEKVSFELQTVSISGVREFANARQKPKKSAEKDQFDNLFNIFAFSCY